MGTAYPALASSDIRSWPDGDADRAISGHWEGDLILWLNRSAIGALVVMRGPSVHAAA